MERAGIPVGGAGTGGGGGGGGGGGAAAGGGALNGAADEPPRKRPKLAVAADDAPALRRRILEAELLRLRNLRERLGFSSIFKPYLNTAAEQSSRVFITGSLNS